MAFSGIGGGVNLGSATGRIFIDGSGMKAGINTAKGALDDFARKATAHSAAVAQAATRVTQAQADAAGRIAESQARAAAKIAEAEAKRIANVTKVRLEEAQKVAAAQLKANQAAAAASKTAVLSDPNTQNKIIDLSNKVADANANATKIIAQGYKERQAAFALLTEETELGASRQIAAENRLTLSMQRQAALQKKLASIQADLDRKNRDGSLAVTGVDRRSLGSVKGGTSSALKKADVEVANARANLTVVASEVASTMAKISSTTSGAIKATLDAEKAAVNESRKAIAAQAKDFEKFGEIAGKSGIAAANAVKKAGQEVVKATDAFHGINSKIVRQQEITAASSGLAQLKSLEVEKKLESQRIASLDRVRNAQIGYEQAVKSFSGTINSIAVKDAAAAKAASDLVVAAKQTEAKKIIEVQTAENAAVTRIQRAETDTVLKNMIKEADGVTKVKERETARVIELEREKNAALANVQQVAVGSVLQTATIATIALGAAVGATTMQFASFDEALHNIASISNDANFVFTEMRANLESLAVQRGQGPTDLAKALYDIVSSGFDGAQALEVLNASSLAAVAGLTNVASAGKSLTAVLNAYKNAGDDVRLTFEDVGRVSDVAFAAVREGVFTFEELTQQQGDNLSIAAELNVSYAELAASYVVLTRAGNSLSESTTQINGILRTFLKPNEELAAAIDRYGESVLNTSNLTGAGLIQQYGFGAALEFVNEATQGSADALGKLFPNVRALRGEVGLGGRNFQEYVHQLQIMRTAFAEGGDTARAFGIQSQAVAFQLRQSREQIRIAAIELGEHFAPGVLLAAKAAAAAAHAFAGLPDPLQAVIGGVGGFGLAVAASIVVVGNIIKAVISAKEGIQAMTFAIKANTKAMAVWRAVTNPALLAVAALAFVTYKLIQSNRAHKKTVEALNKEYENLKETIDALGNRPDVNAVEAQSLTDLAKKIENIIALQGVLEKQYEDAASASAALNYEAQSVTQTFDDQGNALTTASLGYKDILERIDSLIGKEGQKNLLIDLQTIIGTPDLDVGFVTSEIDRLIAEFQQGVITGDQFNDQIHAMAVNTDALTVSARAAAQGEVAQGKALRNVAEFFGTADEKADEYRKGLQGLIDEAGRLAGVEFDFSSPLGFIQSALGNIGDGAATTLLKLEALNRVEFDDAQMAALDYLSTMEQWQKKIDEVNLSIDASQNAMSNWQNIIGLISDTVGTAADGYQGLNELLRRGKIDQQEYNSIKEAAIFLNERSKLGIEDERTAIAKSLPDLAAFVNEHDLAVKKYDALDPAARGFAAAMQDANRQAIIMTAIMVNLAHALDPENFPTSFVTTFIANVSQADPVTGALLDKLGLIPEEIRTQLILDADAPLETIDQISERQAQILTLINEINKTPAAAQTADQLAQVQALGKEYKRLEDLKVTIPIEVDGAGGLPQLESGIEDLTDTSETSAQAIADAFSSAKTDIDDVGQSVAAVIPELIRASIGAADFGEPFEFLRKKMGLVGESFARVLLQAEKAGKIQFTQAERSALSLRYKLDKVNASLEETSAEIQNNESDMAMWQGRIDLIDKTIGTSTDTYAQYEQALAEGRITQEEFNKAVSDGTAHRAYAELNQLVETRRISEEEAAQIIKSAEHLRARSVGGILDERAAIALSIIDLDKYVTAHDHLDQKYKDLQPEQKGFLAALNDQAVQTALNSFLMLSFLEAMGQVAKGTAGQFAELTAANNDVVRAVFEDLGILENGVVIPYAADTSSADAAVEDTKAKAGEDVTFEVKPVTGDGTGGPQDVSSDQVITITADTSEATLQIDALNEHMRTGVAQALEYGASTGIAYTSGIIGGITFKEPELLGALVLLDQEFIDDAARIRIHGVNAGFAFDQGIAAGIYRASTSVSAAGNYIGRLLFASTMLAILARSPSKKGAEVGQSYIQGIVVGLDSEGASASAKAAAIAQNINSAFEGGLATSKAIGIDAIRSGSALSPTLATVPRNGSAAAAAAGNVITNNLGPFNITVEGGSSESGEVVANKVYAELYASLRKVAILGVKD